MSRANAGQPHHYVVACPACFAPVGHRCSTPTNEGRREVDWVHYARERAADDAMAAQDKS